jgi:catechol 2,3-dioxygenase-like lactoylglutathione lyase family enzyme
VISVSVSVDVPSLEEGIRFYSEAFGFEIVSSHIPEWPSFACPVHSFSCSQRVPAPRPAPPLGPRAAMTATGHPFTSTFTSMSGASQEQLFEAQGRPSVAFCCDPLGHGFCLIETRKA